MKYFDDDCISNDSANPILDKFVQNSRRHFLLGGISAAALAGMGVSMPTLAAQAAASAGRVMRGKSGPAIGFLPVSVSQDDLVRVPDDYQVEVVYAWGDPISDGPAFKPDASNSAAEQALQAGMHHDGMHFFPFVKDGKPVSDRGLLVVNHEYVDDGLLHPGGMNGWSADKVAKSQAAHGVSVVEVRKQGGRWEVVRPSKYARRVTAATPIWLSGPVAGSDWVKTAADPKGHLAFGTFNNCAMGVTPWGTYLTCEENFNNYFEGSAKPASVASGALEKRYGIKKGGSIYRWNEFDTRFDLNQHPNEANRFGWVVEIDPWNPMKPPVKRTALGRIKHEGATVTLAKDGRVVVYMGDDGLFEYLYKFVSKDRYDPARPGANADLLDRGTLYVARFGEDGKGRWLPLVHGRPGLTSDNGFADQADVLVKTRLAADAVGATKMDRPEWIAVHPVTGEVYCSLTNNTKRGAADAAATDKANPRVDNVFGHIIRWRDEGGAAGDAFGWDIFALAGDPANPDPAKRGNVKGDAFGSPDGLWFDPEGRLWIQTDVSTSVLNQGDYANLGNNQMLCADVETGQIKRFLTGPKGCEITGITRTPDGTTLFINIQHPGENPQERSDPANPTAISAWPGNQFSSVAGGRPRSATIAISRKDGKVVGI